MAVIVGSGAFEATTDASRLSECGAQLICVPTPLGDTGLQWRNAAYAVQWWVFALFALWLWWRMVREEHRSRGAAGVGPAEDDDAEPTVEPGVEPGVGPDPAPGDNGVREHL